MEARTHTLDHHHAGDGQLIEQATNQRKFRFSRISQQVLLKAVDAQIEFFGEAGKSPIWSSPEWPRLRGERKQ